MRNLKTSLLGDINNLTSINPPNWQNCSGKLFWFLFWGTWEPQLKGLCLLNQYLKKYLKCFFKKVVLFQFGECWAKRIYHFFLTMISLRHIVSGVWVSKFFVWLAKNPWTALLLLPKLKFRSLQNAEDWYSSFWIRDSKIRFSFTNTKYFSKAWRSI